MEVSKKKVTSVSDKSNTLAYFAAASGAKKAEFYDAVARSFHSQIVLTQNFRDNFGYDGEDSGEHKHHGEVGRGHRNHRNKFPHEDELESR